MSDDINIDFWTHEMLCGLINYAWTTKKQFPDLQSHQAGDLLHDFITTIQQEEKVNVGAMRERRDKLIADLWTVAKNDDLTEFEQATVIRAIDALDRPLPKCPVCGLPGYFGGGVVTLMAVESYGRHYHDPNKRPLSCDNRHTWYIDVPCPVAECNWNMRTPAEVSDKRQDRKVADERPQLSREQIDDMNSGD